MIKKMLRVVALVLVLCLLPSCSTQSAVKKGTKPITACVGSEPQSIDPAINQSVDGATYISHVFEGLTKTDKNNQMAAGAASDWTVSSDGLTYTFHLRKDAKWSDGNPVVAGDFVYAWQRAVNPGTASPYAYQLNVIKNAKEISSQLVGKDGKPVKAKLGSDGKPATFRYDSQKGEFVKDAKGNFILDASGQYAEDANGQYVSTNADGSATWLNDLGVKAIDSHTLQVTLAQPCSYFLQITALPTLYPVRQDIVEKNPDTWTNSPSTYIGNGPYKLKEWDHNSKIVLEKNQNYYDKENIVTNEIDFLLMDDQNAILAAYKSGSLLLSEDMPTDEIPALVKSGDCKIYGNLSTYYYVFNTQQKPFVNAKVREALSLAVDRQYLVDNTMKAGQIAAGAFVPVQIPDAANGSDFRSVGKNYYNPSTAGYSANVTKAKQLLAEAGYANGSGFPTVELKINTNDTNKKIAEYITNEWKKNLNIQVNIHEEDWKVFQTEKSEGNYSIACDSFVGDYVDPMTFLDLYTTDSGNNDAGWSNAQYDKLITDAKKITNTSDRMKDMHQAEDILMSDFPVMPIFFDTDPDLVSKHLKGYVHSTLGIKYLMWAYRDN